MSCNVLPMPNNFRFISKLPPQSTSKPFDDACEASWQHSLDLSLQRMRLRSLDALLLHSSSDLLRPDCERLLDWLRTVVHRGQVKRIGVSIYSSQELAYLPLEHLQIVQLPCSLYDQRLITDGTVQSLVSQGIAVHARSLYLQGLLVTPPQYWPQNAPPSLLRHHHKLYLWAKSNDWNLVQLALAWARRQSWMEAAVIGVTSSSEFEELYDAWSGPDPWEFHDPEAWAWPFGSDLDLRQWV